MLENQNKLIIILVSLYIIKKKDGEKCFALQVTFTANRNHSVTAG